MLVQGMGQVGDTIHVTPIKVGRKIRHALEVRVRQGRRVAVVHGIGANLQQEETRISVKPFF